MGFPVDKSGPASNRRAGKQIANLVWVALTRWRKGGIFAQGTDHLSDRDRRDIGISKQRVSARLAREMTKLDRNVFR